MSSLDLGIELGHGGTVKNNFVKKENFLNLTIGINFTNKWFEKQYLTNLHNVYEVKKTSIHIEKI